MTNEQIKAAAYTYRTMFDDDIGLDGGDLVRLSVITEADEIRALEGNDGLSAGQAGCLINEL